MVACIRIFKTSTLPNGKEIKDTIGYLPSKCQTKHAAIDSIIASYIRSSSFWDWPSRTRVWEQLKEYQSSDVVKVGWGIDLSLNAVEHLAEFVL